MSTLDEIIAESATLCDDRGHAALVHGLPSSLDGAR